MASIRPAIGLFCGHGTGLRCLFSCSARPRPPLRRAVFRGRRFHARLLPPYLSGATAQAREHALLFQRSRGGRRGLQAVPALPAGTRARSRAHRCREPAGRRRHRRYRRARAVQHPSGRARGVAGSERPPFTAGHGIRTRRVADRARADAAAAVRKALARRNPVEPDGDRLRQRLRQRAAVQCLVQIALSLESAGAARHGERGGRLALPIGISSALRVASTARLLALRAIPGVEMADATHYRRTVPIDDTQGWIAVSFGKKTMRSTWSSRRRWRRSSARSLPGSSGCSIWARCPMR